MSTVAYVLLLFMLIDTSSMLEIYMIGVAFVMVYILELIMKLSNRSTVMSLNQRRGTWELALNHPFCWIKHVKHMRWALSYVSK